MCESKNRQKDLFHPLINILGMVYEQPLLSL